jgi:sulfonate transport system permease protein
MAANLQPEILSRRDADATDSFMRRGWGTLASGAQGLIVPAVLLILWEGVVRKGWISANLLPPPSALVGTLRELTSQGEIYQHVLISTARTLIGFGVGAGLAVLIGTVVGLSKPARVLLDPTFQGLRAIPSLAWVPLLLLWFGIDELPKIILIAVGAFFPVYLNLVSGIQNVDRKLVELGRVYELSSLGLVRRIFIPAALPSLFVGLRSGLSLAWMFLVAAELIAATKGIGYLLSDGRETGRADLVMVAILTLALLGKLSDGLLAAIERYVLRWRDVYGTTGG